MKKSLRKAGFFCIFADGKTCYMETRTITQIKVYYLAMNGVYDSAEGGSIAAVSTSRERLMELYNREILPAEERYRDDMGRYRSFREGPLHGYNPLYSFNPNDSHFGHGLREEWMMMEEFDNVKHRYHYIPE